MAYRLPRPHHDQRRQPPFRRGRSSLAREPIKRLRLPSPATRPVGLRREQALGRCRARVQEAVGPFETVRQHPGWGAIPSISTRAGQRSWEAGDEFAGARRAGRRTWARSSEAENAWPFWRQSTGVAQAMAGQVQWWCWAEDVSQRRVFSRHLGLRRPSSASGAGYAAVRRHDHRAVHRHAQPPRDLKPVMEIQFAGFIYAPWSNWYPAAQPLRNRAAAPGLPVGATHAIGLRITRRSLP